MAMFIVQKAAVAPLIISLCAGSPTAVCLSVLFTVCCHLNHVGSVCNLFIYLFNWHLLQIRLPWIHICVADGTALLYGCHQQRTSIWRSWRIFKQHKARHSDLSGLCVCACVCVQYISLFFFLITRTCLARLVAPLKFNEIRMMCKRGLYKNVYA